MPDLARRASAEAAGTGLLLAAIVGSGIMGDRLSAGNIALALLANSIATGAVLLALILTFGPVSGAHFNPAVTFTEAWLGRLPWRDVPLLVGAQVAGASVGVIVAEVMFGASVLARSAHVRAGVGQLVGELVATFGLLIVIRGGARDKRELTACAVAAYITGAYWFTSSTSFANPAVTIARALTDTFAGIRPADVPAFVLAQLVGAAAGTALVQWLDQPTSSPTLTSSDRNSYGQS